VDAVSKTGRVRWVVGAGYDALVRPTLPMKASEVGMVVREDSTLVSDGIGKNDIIANALACSARLPNGADIMSQAAQLLDDR
jgi:hypothetical protein